MKQFVCENCGANENYEKENFRVCKYCGSRFLILDEDLPQKSSNIALNDDIQRLIEKCKREPYNARRYANLILDLDPHNKEARKYL